MESRSSDILYKINWDDREIIFRKRKTLDLTVAAQVPTHTYIIERFLTLRNDDKLQKRHENPIINELCTEIITISEHFNIAMKARQVIKNMIQSIIDDFKELFEWKRKKIPKDLKQRQSKFLDELDFGLQGKIEN